MYIFHGYNTAARHGVLANCRRISCVSVLGAPLPPPNNPKSKETLNKSSMRRVAVQQPIAGGGGGGGIPAPEARAHRVMPPTPQNRVRGHVGLVQCIPSVASRIK